MMENAQAKDLKPVVISSQRSGLNFLRICIETLTGKRTPGKTLLVESGPTSFVRTHDAASLSGKDEGSWKEIDDDFARDRKVVLLIRDPFEIYARELKIATTQAARYKLDLYVSNLNRYCSLECDAKRHFHYEDFTTDPNAMTALIGFLDIRRKGGAEVDEETVAGEWERMQEAGRDLYDQNQKNAGGSMSRNAENRLVFHQTILADSDKNWIGKHLQEKASPEGRAILARYLPSLA